jgi:hypothetical protein
MYYRQTIEYQYVRTISHGQSVMWKETELDELWSFLSWGFILWSVGLAYCLIWVVSATVSGEQITLFCMVETVNIHTDHPYIILYED